MAVDTTGISLSTSDPDLNNHPAALGDGGAWEAEDYCTAELQHGDILSGLLDAACAPSSAVTPRLKTKARSGGCGCGGAKNQPRNYVLIGAVILVLLILLFAAE